MASNRHNVTPRLTLENTNACLDTLLDIMANADARYADRSCIEMPRQEEGRYILSAIDPFFQLGGLTYDNEYEHIQVRFKTIVYLQFWQRRTREWFMRIEDNDRASNPNYIENFRPKEIYLIMECAVQFYLLGEEMRFIEILQRDFDILEQCINSRVYLNDRLRFQKYLVLLHHWKYPVSRHPRFNVGEIIRVMASREWMKLKQCGFMTEYECELFPIDNGYVREADELLDGDEDVDPMILNRESGVYNLNLTRFIHGHANLLQNR